MDQKIRSEALQQRSGCACFLQRRPFDFLNKGVPIFLWRRTNLRILEMRCTSKNTQARGSTSHATDPGLSAQLQAAREKGRQEGRSLERLELAKALLVEGHSFALVSGLTGLSREQITAFCEQKRL
ncbi:MAG: hypothetical protein ROO73_03550 [Roseivirga sp.]